LKLESQTALSSQGNMHAYAGFFHKRSMKLELAVAGWKDWLCSWEVQDKTEDKTDPRSREDLFVAAIAEDFIFREDKTAWARLLAL